MRSDNPSLQAILDAKGEAGKDTLHIIDDIEDLVDAATRWVVHVRTTITENVNHLSGQFDVAVVRDSAGGWEGTFRSMVEALLTAEAIEDARVQVVATVPRGPVRYEGIVTGHDFNELRFYDGVTIDRESVLAIGVLS